MQHVGRIRINLKKQGNELRIALEVQDGQNPSLAMGQIDRVEFPDFEKGVELEIFDLIPAHSFELADAAASQNAPGCVVKLLEGAVL